MMRAQGVVSEAERLFDCSYFQYYWNIVAYNNYVKKNNESLKIKPEI